MIIRHDLRLAFLHIPKCAGKSLRQLFKRGGEASSTTELWDYHYNRKLHRYVDLAHLPADDLAHFKAFRQLRRYRTVAVSRHPYLRLASAIKEFHRQRSKADEQRVNAGTLTRDDQLNYLRALPLHLAMLDPRYIHALPMRRFSHYGNLCLVTHWLRCETLRQDWTQLVEELQLPVAWLEGASQRLQASDALEREALGPAADALIAVANRLYAADFSSFGYERWPDPTLDAAGEELVQEWDQPKALSHTPLWIHQAGSLEWHWGPTARRRG
jgi:hypothetical protein